MCFCLNTSNTQQKLLNSKCLEDCKEWLEGLEDGNLMSSEHPMNTQNRGSGKQS